VEFSDKTCSSINRLVQKLHQKYIKWCWTFISQVSSFPNPPFCTTKNISQWNQVFFSFLSSYLAKSSRLVGFGKDFVALCWQMWLSASVVAHCWGGGLLWLKNAGNVVTQCRGLVWLTPEGVVSRCRVFCVSWIMWLSTVTLWLSTKLGCCDLALLMLCLISGMWCGMLPGMYCGQGVWKYCTEPARPPPKTKIFSICDIFGAGSSIVFYLAEFVLFR
jgi:hypothetical protein